MGFQLNIVKNSATNYCLSGGRVLTVVSGAITSNVPVVSGGIVVSGGVTSGARIDVAYSGGVVLSTTMPEDNTEAYQQFISEKRLAIASGGTASLNGTVQEFKGGYFPLQSAMCVGANPYISSGGKYIEKGGYLNFVSANCLMTLNGVRGYLDAPNKRCNIDINPTLGVWAEQVSVSSSCNLIKPVTVLRGISQCVTCDDYNKLFAAEMVMYHAINKVAWKLLDNGIHISPNNTITVGPAGAWYRYEGIIAYWNFIVFKSSFLDFYCSIRETLAVNVGYANPTCDPKLFVCASVVERTVNGITTEALRNRMIFYPGPILTQNEWTSNNNYIDGAPIPFILCLTRAATPQVLLYCGPGTSAERSKARKILTNITKGCSVTIGGRTYDLSSLISRAYIRTDMNDFRYYSQHGRWILGLAGNVVGQQYAATGYTLGAHTTEGAPYRYAWDRFDRYSVLTRWWVTTPLTNPETQSTTTKSWGAGPFQKYYNPREFKTYSVAPPLSQNTTT